MKGIVLWLFIIAIWGAVIYRHRDLYKMFGEVQWAQKIFGDSLILYPLIWVALIVIGILFMFGMWTSPWEIEVQLGQ
jgi:hypothetical protein